jgi:hypothetical protein
MPTSNISYTIENALNFGSNLFLHLFIIVSKSYQIRSILKVSAGEHLKYKSILYCRFVNLTSFPILTFSKKLPLACTPLGPNRLFNFSLILLSCV